ncbi:hypothetical protein KKY_2020 [Pelagibacterium halotolerans B2]|uniref:Uncharacterized protein n=1 Tax=Pelagibacterium halotolerans (strain DSM 22347 / JCM 15775 / CGMCC 1.7692 / B2) TaxID=1082931 RepID=G4RG16_PELHB|nr:hypothetical protein KKY_2020 [Pelagibacterium halotolerans B2]
MDASATNVWAGSVRVPCGSPQGRPKADGWPDEEWYPRRTEETRRGTAEGTSDGVIPTNPSPRRRHKPKTPDAWGDDRFIYTNFSAERSSPHAVYPIRNRGDLAVGGFCAAIAPHSGLSYIRPQVSETRISKEAPALWRVNSSIICTACPRPIPAGRRSSTT